MGRVSDKPVKESRETVNCWWKPGIGFYWRQPGSGFFETHRKRWLSLAR